MRRLMKHITVKVCMQFEMNFPNSLRMSPKSERLVSREVGFDGSMCTQSYPIYAPFYDVHMREYWLSPITRRRLMQFGFLTKDGRNLIDPDKERKRIETVKKQIYDAECLLAVRRERAKSKLILESAWLQRQLVKEIRRGD